MMRYALLNGDIVENILIAAEGYQHSTLETIALDEYQYCEIGYVYDRVSQTFTPAIDPVALEAAKNEKIASLQTSATAEIESGFVCISLGSQHHYEYQVMNQVNLLAQIDVLRRGTGWAEWTCTEISTGIKDARPHSLSQLETVLDTGMAANIQVRTKYRTLVNQVVQATTIDAVNAIVWY